MKNDNSVWLLILAFAVGALVSFIGTEYHYFQIDYKINIVTSLISITTAAIGLFIAISLKKSQSKSSNLHSYLQPKLNLIWELFLPLSHQLSLNDQIELSKVLKAKKEIDQNLTPLKKIFSSFELKDDCLKEIEVKLETLEKMLVDDCKMHKNIINYSEQRTLLRTKLDDVHTQFALALKFVNRLS